MDELSFNRYKRLLAWAAFFIALITYGLTVAPTVSFWDCGEYIAAAAKLEVAHPPGAPLFQMIGAVFALFATDKTAIAQLVNYMSVLASAFTIHLMFLTLVALIKLSLNQSRQKILAKGPQILGGAFIGSMCFAFSDSFWFNAVETEVYAMASLIMALLLWLGLKWVANLGNVRNQRYLLMIAFVIGLTFGVQFMGFLAIPSIVLLYGFKRWPKMGGLGFVGINLLAIGLLVLVFKISFTYVLKCFGWGEVFFVNTLGLPFNSGSIAIGLLFFLLFFMTLYYTRQSNYFKLHKAVLCIMLLFVGFSTWLVLPIRANAHVVINENSPADARALLAYYNREQYPSVENPFYGAYYSSKFAAAGPRKDDNPKFEKDKSNGRYVVVNPYKNANATAAPEHKGFLPRLWSAAHAENYMRHFGLLTFKIKPEYQDVKELRELVVALKRGLAANEVDVAGYVAFLEDYQNYISVVPPTLWQNVRYLLQYQWGYMYWRYFMWNFAGKQDDEQGRYNNHGNWLSGIGFIDALRLGSQKELPALVLDNKGRNKYYFLPLLLGLIGVCFHLKKDPKRFWVLLVFFVLAGLGIQFYTNPPIFQPRERDYSLVGSFYIFAVWIGLGAYALLDYCKVFFAKRKLVLVGIGLLLGVPGLMAFQNWDDHDRSQRRTALASAKAYLDSTQLNAGALLFTVGDNDNFPLWYAQEIEGYRTDVRVIVTGYLAADWYIDQMKRKTYQSNPIPSQFTHKTYRYGSRDYSYHHPLTEKRWDIKDFIDWVASDHPKTKRKYLLQQKGVDTTQIPEADLAVVYYPTNKIRIPVNKQNVVNSGLVSKKDEELLVDYIDIDLPDVLYKNNLIMLDVLANNNWERPIYFSGGSFDDADYIWLKDYLQLDGLSYKLVPIKTPYKGSFEMGRVDTALSLKIVKQWDWGNAGSASIYHDPQTRRQFGVTFRLALARLMTALLEEEKCDQAAAVIDLAMTNIPVKYYGYYAFVEPYLEGYYKLGQTQKANALFNQLKTYLQESLNHYLTLDRETLVARKDIVVQDLLAYKRLIDILAENDTAAKVVMETEIFDSYLDLWPTLHF